MEFMNLFPVWLIRCFNTQVSDYFLKIKIKNEYFLKSDIYEETHNENLLCKD